MAVVKGQAQCLPQVLSQKLFCSTASVFSCTGTKADFLDAIGAFLSSADTLDDFEVLDDVGASELDLNLISCFSKDKTYLFNFLKDDFKSKNRVKMSKCSYIRIPSCLDFQHSSVPYYLSQLRFGGFE
jgi:hypothetical protein